MAVATQVVVLVQSNFPDRGLQFTWPRKVLYESLPVAKKIYFERKWPVLLGADFSWMRKTLEFCEIAFDKAIKSLKMKTGIKEMWKVHVLGCNDISQSFNFFNPIAAQFYELN